MTDCLQFTQPWAEWNGHIFSILYRSNKMRLNKVETVYICLHNPSCLGSCIISKSLADTKTWSCGSFIQKWWCWLPDESYVWGLRWFTSMIYEWQYRGQSNRTFARRDHAASVSWLTFLYSKSIKPQCVNFQWTRYYFAVREESYNSRHFTSFCLFDCCCVELSDHC